ncbi:hypothetical protein N665_0081s0020 [Sinapis alba]|nr:hypothetical protein N665_0081s0020 [Sinapis alba]
MRPVTLFMLSFILISLVGTCVKYAEAQKQRCILKSSKLYEGSLCSKTGDSDCILKSKQVPKPFKCNCINSWEYSTVTTKTVAEFLRNARKLHTCMCDTFCKS